jgi:hypothetical protein
MSAFWRFELHQQSAAAFFWQVMFKSPVLLFDKSKRLAVKLASSVGTGFAYWTVSSPGSRVPQFFFGDGHNVYINHRPMSDISAMVYNLYFPATGDKYELIGIIYIYKQSDDTGMSKDVLTMAAVKTSSAPRKNHP